MDFRETCCENVIWIQPSQDCTQWEAMVLAMLNLEVILSECYLVCKDESQIFFLLQVQGSQGSSVSIVSDYGLDDRGSIPDRGRGFFF
jgi:hypothetical protein